MAQPPHLEKIIPCESFNSVSINAGLPVVLKFLKFPKCHRCPEIVLKSAIIVLKFYSFAQNVLIWTLIFKFVVTRWHLSRLNAPNSISAGAPPQTPLGELTALPQTAP